MSSTAPDTAIDENARYKRVIRTAEELFSQYTSFGEDAWISSDDASCNFSAWQYAKERCAEFAGNV